MKKFILIITFLTLINSGYTQWVNQYNSPGVDFYDIEFINNKTGWVCGTGIILKTTNSGANWINQVGIPQKALFGIHAVNENIVYCVGYYQTILKTTNGGDNWIILENGPSGSGSSYTATFFINELTGWVGGYTGGYIKKTTNGGISFFNQSLNFIARDIYFKDSVNGISCSGAATIASTSNGGDDWFINQYNSVSHGSGDFNRMSFINEFTGYTVGANRLVYKTTNFGATWDSISYINNSLAPQCIKFVNDSVGYCAGSGGEIFMSKDKGLTWIRQTNQIGGYIYDIKGYKDSLWVCASIGKIAFTANGGVFIQNISNEIPSSFNLQQNYPNPFNPSAKIKYDLKISSYVSLKIFDINGKEIQTLVNKKQSAGSYEVNFDGANLPSGIYFCSLQAGDFKETRKMILVK